MKKFLIAVAFFLSVSPAHARLIGPNDPPPPSYYLAPTHWSYAVLDEVFAISSLQKYDNFSESAAQGKREGLRLQIAVSIARITDVENDRVDNPRAKGLSIWDATPKTLEQIDIMAALQVEFAPEIERLSQRM